MKSYPFLLFFISSFRSQKVSGGKVVEYKVRHEFHNSQKGKGAMKYLKKFSTFLVISLIVVSCFTTAVAQTPLSVTSVFPVDGAVDIPVSVSPQVSFSFTLDPATITSASAFLTGPLGNIVPAESRISSPDQVAIDPTDFLTPGTTYTIHITPVLQDTAGNSLDAEFTSSFTTAGLPVPSDSDDDGIPDAEDICPGTVIPEAVPTESLGVNRFALTDGDAIFDTTRSPGKKPGQVLTLADTAGCSCAQIIEVLGLDEGHTKFGCSSSAMKEWIEIVHP
jgi:hypothetical protein